MNLLPTREQESIFATADGLFAELFPLSRFRSGGSIGSAQMAECWRRLGEMGLIGVCVPVSAGGSGLTLVEQALVCEALGRRLAPLELVSTMLAAEAALAGGDGSLASALMNGENAAGVLFPEAADRGAGLAPREGTWVAYGTPHLTVFLFSSADMEGTIRTDGLSGPWLDCLATELSLAEGIRLPDDAVSNAGGGLFARGVVLMAAVLVGVSQAALQMAVEHAQTRVQFGAPIGVNQAIRHPCAEVAVGTKLARSQLYHAALAVEAKLSDSARLAAYAKVLAAKIALESCSNNIQFHGGMGLTDDFPAHAFLKFSHIARNWFGSSEYHLARIIENNA